MCVYIVRSFPMHVSRIQSSVKFTETSRKARIDESINQNGVACISSVSIGMQLTPFSNDTVVHLESIATINTDDQFISRSSRYLLTGGAFE